MRNLENAFIEQLYKGESWAAIVIVILLIIFNLSKIYEFFSIILNRRKNHINSLIKDSQIDDNIKKLLNNELNKITFRDFTGLYIGKIERDKLIELIDNNLSNFTLKEIKISKKYLDFYKNENNDINLRVNMGFISYIYAFFCAVMVLFLVAVGNFCFASVVASSEYELKIKILILLLISFVFYGLASVYMKDIFALWTAFKIKKLLPRI